MINLLPDEHKKEIRAARTNVLLLRYVILLISAAVFLTASLGIVHYYLAAMKTTAQATINENADRENEFSSAKAEADKFRSELSSAKNILDSQISYSKAIVVVSELLPSGTSISSLKLDESSFGSTMQLSVQLPNDDSAREVVDSFTSSEYVSNFDRDTLSVSDDGDSYTMPISFTLSKEAAKR